MFNTKQQKQKASPVHKAVPYFPQLPMVILVSAIFSLFGCMSVIRGTSETLEIKTEAYGKPLVDATCIIQQGNQHWSVVTPGKLVLHRDNVQLHVTCTKDGYRMPNASDIAADSSHLLSASGGAFVGGTVGAVGMGLASAPFLIIPVVGWTTFAGSVAAGAGVGALAGGAVSAGTDAASGATYTYQSPIIIPMIPVEENPSPVNENN